MTSVIRGEVWWVRFDPAEGNEVNKTRPAIILSNDGSNLPIGRALVVPPTRSIRRVHKTETLVQLSGGVSKAMIDQMRVADRRRIGRFVETLPETEIMKVVETIKEYLDIA